MRWCRSIRPNCWRRRMRETLRGATVAQARRALAERFRAAGIESPELDARVLIGHALGLDHAGLASGAAQPCCRCRHRSNRAVRRTPPRGRAGRAHHRRKGILGTAACRDTRPCWCRGRTPKPWSSLRWKCLIATARARARCGIADLGTGSGAILLALLRELPNAHGIGTDIDPHALAVARANAQRLRFDERASFRGMQITARHSPARSISWCRIRPTSQAPTSRRLRAKCASTIRATHSTAARTDLRRIAQSPRMRRAVLSSNGHLVVEIGAGQQKDVEFLLTSRGLAIASVRHDLSGIPRAIAARRNA